MDVIRAKRKPYMRRGKPAAILDRAHDSNFRIVARYQAEFRGIAEYYQLAYNRHRLGSLRYVMERSMAKSWAIRTSSASARSGIVTVPLGRPPLARHSVPRATAGWLGCF